MATYERARLGRRITYPVAAATLLAAAACGGRTTETPGPIGTGVEPRQGDSVPTSSSQEDAAAPPALDASTITTTGEGGFTVPSPASPPSVVPSGCSGGGLIHIAVGVDNSDPGGNYDFDVDSVCAGDVGSSSGPVGYFVTGGGGALVIAGCTSNQASSEGIQIVAKGAGTGTYETDAVTFVDRHLATWSYQGPAPVPLPAWLGDAAGTTAVWRVNITQVDDVGGTIAGTYSGTFVSGQRVENLMGYFHVCRAKDMAGR
jgi:hypothetical protein